MVGLVFVWILAAAVAAAIGRFTASYDRPMPWATLLPVTLAGAAVGGLLAVAATENFPAGAAGGVIGAGAALAIRVVTQVKPGSRTEP